MEYGFHPFPYAGITRIRFYGSPAQLFAGLSGSCLPQGHQKLMFRLTNNTVTSHGYEARIVRRLTVT
ncbi:hypothetical protein MNBD_NITROSPIRAE03-1725 [hydrothermal vent metagenome]|uniref:Uncharacterized protein n=1 Tax=hydrothermal vent metagenome TaxID=652676 RepID=A0A3B1D115_9ZZZZ